MIRPLLALVLVLQMCPFLPSAPPSAAAATVDFPSPQGYITDTAGVLDAPTKAALTVMLRELEAETTAEIAVVTVQRLDGLSIEEYAVDLFNQWGVGQKKENNGVLVLIAVSDRRVRIEVGYGLEPILPDGLAGEVIRKQFLPKFRASDFAGGVRDGVDRIATIVRGRQVVPPDVRKQLDEQNLQDNDRSRDWIMVPFFGLFILVGFTAIGLGVRVKAFGAILFGLLMGGIVFLLALMMIPQWTWTILAPIGAAMLVVGYTQGRKASWRRIVRQEALTRGWVMGSSPGGGSSGSSGSSSGGSSSSSDSFGGGSSGGGGASGSW